MIYINEWLPNPAGRDSDGEWVEIFNSGTESINCSGWQLKFKDSKSTTIGGIVSPESFLVIRRPKFSLTLHNENGGISLVDSRGNIIDAQSFVGQAPEGKSFSRNSEGVFMFSDPTPGQENIFSGQANLISNNYPLGQLLNKPFGLLDLISLILGVGIVLSGLVIFIIKRNENLSNIIFGED